MLIPFVRCSYTLTLIYEKKSFYVINICMTILQRDYEFLPLSTARCNSVSAINPLLCRRMLPNVVAVPLTVMVGKTVVIGVVTVLGMVR